MTERTFEDRVDDAVLVAAWRLSRVRDITLRGALGDVRQSFVDNAADSAGTTDEGIWRLRVDRCDMLNAEPNDNQLRARARAAVERDR